MQFLKLTNGNYINVAQIFSIYAIADATDWNVEVAASNGASARISTPGPFATQVDAQEFIRVLVQGFDAGTV